MASDGSTGSKPLWKRALVTGASSGIGEAMAQMLSDQGTDLVLVARAAERLDVLAESLSGNGITVEVLPADLTVSADLVQVEHRVASTAGRVDLLINNAGFGGYAAVTDRTPDDEQEMIDLNVTALVRLCSAAAPQMCVSGQGGILNTSSTAGFQPAPRAATYAASKAFVTSFSQGLHEELRGDGVHVTALCPGFTHTDFHVRADQDESGIPSILWSEVEEVAAAGLAGVASNTAIVVPGLPNKMTALSVRLLPSSVVRWASGQVMNRL